MTVLFRRRVRLVVAPPVPDNYASIDQDATEIVDLRVTFKVEKDLSKHPNTAQVTVTNLAPERRAIVEAPGARLLLHAGYGDALALVYRGDARTVESKRDGVDWQTTFQCGDGERAFIHARVNESFAPNTLGGDVVKRLAERLGLDGTVAAAAAGMNRRFVGGYTAFGRASAELDRCLKTLGYEYSIQDGVLEVRQPGEASTEEAVVISPDHGLIGTVEVGSATKKKGKPTLKGKNLLDAAIRPGRLLDLQTESIKGRARVIKVTHNGDTDGANWFTEWEAETA